MDQKQVSIIKYIKSKCIMRDRDKIFQNAEIGVKWRMIREIVLDITIVTRFYCLCISATFTMIILAEVNNPYRIRNSCLLNAFFIRCRDRQKTN